LLFRDQEHHEEPFAGIIVGTYDTRIPSTASIINWFYVQNDNSAVRRRPMYLVHDIVEDTEINKKDGEKIEKLLELYKNFESRTNFKSTWRFTVINNNTQKTTDTTSLSIDTCITTSTTKDSDIRAQDNKSNSDNCNQESNSTHLKPAPITKLQKMKESLQQRLPLSFKPEQSTVILNKITDFIEKEW